MINKRAIIKTFSLGFCAAVLLACQNQATIEAQDSSVSTFYLVRHAEKVLDGKDPLLTDIGTQRAKDLAKHLNNVPLTKIYSTDTRRTRDTAKPTAEAKALEITLYDASDLPAFADILKSQEGQILIVGHSNTTPDLAQYLGDLSQDNPSIRPINEAQEYDRFYKITRINKGEDVKTVTVEQTTYGQLTPIVTSK